ncbi:hypothetical protein CAOG_08653 [Capsaspora owczarzaki ATCC 30864]|uniref:Phosphatidylinositol-4-phosphate 5-kinase n=1 Tax=Capsaspora owczarzaki (strain ATCC 30864) TaxID=595528 RepID=A0A0D2WMD5_CAPO3|nr:hypothetical protein CAOG_08653 [Capsaspora owczarzaki ATCC 30864]KJE91970.1 hypothetical protein CAOG_008653 [Capsaspora owczarzaki ATCC 30864]|eukprot:XP_011270264.1 hypothetical protein CAOG_08653 [Capsaspora owczarzaki ATCC 30864]
MNPLPLSTPLLLQAVGMLNHSNSSSLTTLSNEDTGDNNNHALLYFIGGLLSALFCGLQVVSYALFPRLRQHPSQIASIRAMCDFIFNLGFIFVYIFGEPGGDSNACLTLALVNQFMAFASNGWYLVLSIDLFKAIRNPFFVPTDYMKVYHLFVWSTSLVTAIVLGVADRWGYSLFDFCWIKVTGPSDLNTFSWVLFYIPIMIFYLASLVVLIVATFALRNGLPESHEARSRVLTQGRRYVTQFFLYWTFAGAVWGAQYGYVSETSHKEYPLIVVFSLTIAVRGLADLVILLWSSRLTPRDYVTAIADLCRRGGKRKSARTASTHHERVTLTQSLLSSEATSAASDLGTAAAAAPSAPATAAAVASAAASDNINLALRKDIMLCTTWAIVDTVKYQHKLAHPRVTVSNTVEETGTAADPEQDPADISPGGAVVDLYASTSDENFSTTHLASDSHILDFEQVVTSEMVKRRGHGKFYFKDYMPAVFEQLRSLFGVSATKYLSSFVARDDLKEERERQMLEKFTEGRSGSFFYFCQDARYIVKTVTSSDLAVLCKILPAYYEHMLHNPDSLLARFCGLHAICLSREQEWIHFVVMENSIFTPLKLHERYDLKGSWIARRSLKEGKTLANVGTMKDTDLINNQRKVKLGAVRSRRMIQQLDTDATFLHSLGIMDYSFLLAVHSQDPNDAKTRAAVARAREFEAAQVVPTASDVATHRPESMLVGEDALNSSFISHVSTASAGSAAGADSHRHASHNIRRYTPFYRVDAGGMQGVDGAQPCLYFGGVIDMLQQYDLSKKLEHFAKTKITCKDAHGISAVEPHEYRDRFVRAMEQMFE